MQVEQDGRNLMPAEEFERLLAELKEEKRSFDAKTGKWLKEIRDRKGYRHHYKSFERFCSEFCKKELGWGSRMHAYRLITAAETAEQIERDTGVKLANTAQATALAQLTPEQRNKIVTHAPAGSSSNDFSRTARELRSQKEREVILNTIPVEDRRRFEAMEPGWKILKPNVLAQKVAVFRGDGKATSARAGAAHHAQIEAVTNAHDSTPTDVGACKAIAQEVKDKVDQFIIHGDFKQLFKDLRDVNVIAAPLPKDIDATTLQEFAQHAASALHKDGVVALIVDGGELPRVLAAVTAEGHLQYRGLGSMQVPRFCTKDHERKINVFHTPVVLLQRPGAAPSWIKDLFVAAPGPMSEPVKSVGAWQALWDGVARPKATVAIPWCGGDGAALVAAVLSGMKFHASDPDANAVKAARERLSAEITAVVSGTAKLLGVEENYEEIFAA